MLEHFLIMGETSPNKFFWSVSKLKKKKFKTIYVLTINESMRYNQLLFSYIADPPKYMAVTTPLGL